MLHVCENETLHSCKYNIILFNKKNNIIRCFMFVKTKHFMFVKMRSFMFVKMKHFILVNIILFYLIRRIILYDASCL